MDADSVLSAADLTTALRQWLRARPEAPEVQATALVYELAALLALHASTVPQACALVDAWRDKMKEQIQILGVGVEHP